MPSELSPQLQGKARARVRFLCPICDKPTPQVEAKLTFKRGDTVEQRDSFGFSRALWTCKHCGATHRDGDEKLIK